MSKNEETSKDKKVRSLRWVAGYHQTSAKTPSTHSRSPDVFNIRNRIIGRSYRKEKNMAREKRRTAAHIISLQQLEAIFRTNAITGLTEGQAAITFSRNGPNELAFKIKKYFMSQYWYIFKSYLFDWFQCALWASAIFHLVVFFFSPSKEELDSHQSKQHLYVALVSIGIAVGSGTLHICYETNNIVEMRNFRKLLPESAIVIRDGKRKVIQRNKVVDGDIVELHEGQIVPADIRLIECTNLKTDMSALTGQILPTSHTSHHTHLNPLESKNMVYFGCPITNGWGKGMVINTGDFSQIGKIAALVIGLQKKQTPLQKDITHLVKIICLMGIFSGCILFVLVFRICNNCLVFALISALCFIFANVPEGLLLTLAVCKRLLKKNLKKKNCLTKTFRAIETLGSVSCICVSKTGILTENKLAVSHILCDFKILDKNDRSFVSDPIYTQLCLAACLNLQATFTDAAKHEHPEKRTVIGDPVEAAILLYMEVNRSASTFRERYPIVTKMDSNAIKDCQITIHEIKDEDEYYLIMKGPTDTILENCSKIMMTTSSDDFFTAPLYQRQKLLASFEENNNFVQDASPDIIKELKYKIVQIENMGEQIIGYADCWISANDCPQEHEPIVSQELKFLIKNLRFLGAISVIDPVRFGIPKSIAQCRKAGIKVAMVTGDNLVSALAISHTVGTITSPTAFNYLYKQDIDINDVPAKSQSKAAVITGNDLHKMSAKVLRKAIQTHDEITFANTSPRQNVEIVENYQALKYVVAFIGNDIRNMPALKKSDIGIASQINRSYIPSEVADMIVLNNNFMTIVLSIKEGRRIINNLKKAIAYTLTSKMPVLLSFVMHAVVGMPQPISYMLILTISIVVDIIPAVSLIFETAETDIMNIPPRKVTDHIFSEHILFFLSYLQVGLVEFCAAMTAYIIVMAEEGFYPPELVFIREEWESEDSEVHDSLGNLWYHGERHVLERKVQTAFFVAVCLTQISNLIICKTRRMSLLQKGMKNSMLNISIFVIVFMAIIVSHFPLANDVLGSHPLSWYHFLIAVPYMIFIIVGDEVRRYFIRNNIYTRMSYING